MWFGRRPHSPCPCCTATDGEVIAPTPGLGRRGALVGGLALLACGAVPRPAGAALAELVPPGRRTVRIRRMQSQETVEATYFRDDRYIGDELARLNWLMRDVTTDEVEVMDPRLFDLLFTVATRMAGRGTDIKLERNVAEAGGLHVIATELNDSGRIDRQLFGRCGRQGDKGSCEAILAMEEDLMKSFFPIAAARFRHLDRLPTRLGKALFRVAQWRAEFSHSRARRELLDLDDYLGDILAFAGRGE